MSGYFRYPAWGSILILCWVVTFGCAGPGGIVIPEPIDRETLSGIRVIPYSERELHQKFLDQYKSWKGTAYRLGGMSRSGIDCSAFVHVTYREKVRVHLPRTTLDLARTGKRISRDDLAVGDLLLF
ncbi:MAG: NlpC/P60 family protein, partial [Thermodesulfobacteriota bacterium]